MEADHNSWKDSSTVTVSTVEHMKSHERARYHFNHPNATAILFSNTDATEKNKNTKERFLSIINPVSLSTCCCIEWST